MYKNGVKIVIDFIIGIVLVLILLIPMMIISVLIKIDSQGPIFFRQTRIGKDGKEFRIFKFRTMVNNADKKGALFTATNDSRITEVGKILRKTSLDEIPQFINMICGDMSLIGPRPDVPEEITDENREFFYNRNSVRPGITGYAQAMGRSSLTLEKRNEYDLYYAEHISSILDIKIVFLTIKAVLLKSGVN